MEVPEDDGDGEEHDITRRSAEKPNQLDDLDKAEHEQELGPNRLLPGFQVPVPSRSPARVDKERVDSEG